MENKKLYFIYDDTANLPRSITSIVGNRKFGDIIHKKTSLRMKIKNAVESFSNAYFIEIRNITEKNAIMENFREDSENAIYIHFHSRAVVVDSDKFQVVLDKIIYTNFTCVDSEIDPFILVFPSYHEYAKYIEKSEDGRVITLDDLGADSIMLSPNDFLLDISDISSFLNFFSGGFEARYFNQLVGDKHTLEKRSSDKLKIEKEYRFYHLIPDRMKAWFVMPYDFKVETDYASYTMERLNVPDMALQWIHNAVSERELSLFLDKVGSFIKNRPNREISSQAYENRFKELYLNKVLERMDKLRSTEQFSKIETYIHNGTEFTLESIMESYQSLLMKIYPLVSGKQEVIGHGDLCFSNILYDKNSYLVKFIDTKGALSENDLWTDPYYDLAKLSHSILGNYDFINNELFSVSLDNTLELQMSLKSRNLSFHQQTFVRKMDDLGYDMRVIRLCEASLFLSMLPLHIDNPRKVVAFILNAINILEELKRNV
jgi:hypothetical protein